MPVICTAAWLVTIPSAGEDRLMVGAVTAIVQVIDAGSALFPSLSDTPTEIVVWPSSRAVGTA